MKPGTQDLHQYWNGIRTKVCTICLHGDARGNCHLDDEIECPIKLRLPSIVSAVNSVPHHAMNDYLTELRLILCDECKHQAVDDRCILGEENNCPLDKHFIHVVNTIKETQRHGHLRTSL